MKRKLIFTLIVYCTLCLPSILFGSSIAFHYDTYPFHDPVQVMEEIYPDFWSSMNTISNDDSETFVNLENLQDLLEYDALYIQNGGSHLLSEVEIYNLEEYIASGRRVVITGEGSPVNAQWNNQILSLVGGTSLNVDTHSYSRSTLVHQLTTNVEQVNFYAADRSSGGLNLFDDSVASLWGDDLNVLTILDTSMWSHVDAGPGYQWNNWDDVDNAIFGDNVITWLVESNPTPVPEPCSLLLLFSGLISFIYIKKKHNP